MCSTGVLFKGKAKPSPWGAGEEEGDWAAPPPPTLPSRQLLQTQGHHCTQKAHSPAPEVLFASTVPTLGKVPYHPAPAFKPAVTSLPAHPTLSFKEAQ